MLQNFETSTAHCHSDRHSIKVPLDASSYLVQSGNSHILAQIRTWSIAVFLNHTQIRNLDKLVGHPKSIAPALHQRPDRIVSKSASFMIPRDRTPFLAVGLSWIALQRSLVCWHLVSFCQKGTISCMDGLEEVRNKYLQIETQNLTVNNPLVILRIVQ